MRWGVLLALLLGLGGVHPAAAENSSRPELGGAAALAASQPNAAATRAQGRPDRDPAAPVSPPAQPSGPSTAELRAASTAPPSESPPAQPSGSSTAELRAASTAPPSESPPAQPSGSSVWGPLDFLGDTVPAGEARRLRFESLDSFTAGLVAMRGVAPGPTVCVTAGVHGDELNGVAIARRLVDETDPAQLAGTLVVVPIVNAYGFRNGSRYLPDRRDLNRYFPGTANGSAASRIAHQFFEQVVRRCDLLVDLHTGSLNRANLPQIRTDLTRVDNLRLAWGFATEHVIHSLPQAGTLRRAANDAGIAAVLYEAGEPGRIDKEEIARGVAAIDAVLGSLGMVQSDAVTPVAQHLYHRTQWVRADASGIYVPLVELGDPIEPGQRVAEVTDPFSSERTEIRAPVGGRVIGMALGQVVIPGFALFHIGIEDGSTPIVGLEGPAQPPANGGPAPADDLRSEFAEERPE